MIVIDTNILISALIKDSITRKILISGLNFFYPEISLVEINKHQEYISKKSEYDKRTFEAILNTLLDYINLVPLEIIRPKIKAARKIMGNIDANDVVFLATALTLDHAVIWSDDADLERQKFIKVLKTKDMIQIFKRQ